MVESQELAGWQQLSPLTYVRPAFSGEAKAPRTKSEAEMSKGADHAYFIEPSTFEFNPTKRRSPNGGSVD